MMVDMKFSVIFPCKNQSAKLLKNIREKGLPFFDALGITYEFLIVIDGSDQKNRKEMEDGLKDLPLQVKLVPFEDTLGKGHNVKHGIFEASGDCVLFMDADFATDLNVLKAMLQDFENYEGFIASRNLKESVIIREQPLLRRLMGRFSRALIRSRFGFQYRDTQCGFKMFKTKLAKEMAKRQIIDGFAFDVEYLYFLKLNGFRVKEYPCVWNDDEDSSISTPLKTSLRFWKDLGRIKKNKKNYFLTNAEKNLLRGEK